MSTKKLILKASSILSRYVDTIVYCALDCAEQHEHLGFERHKRKIILNGFVIEQFAPSTDSYLALRSELGLSPTARIVGIVGRNHPVKDHCNFIKAAGIVAQHFPEIHFVMVGREIDRHNENLNEWIKDQKTLKNIHLLGSRNDMNKILPAFDLFCLSSKIEGFSNVLGEAMLSAVPCVVTDTGASKEIVEGIGLVVERSNHQQLASAIKSMLSLPDDKLKDLGRRSRQRIIERYSIENIVLEYQKMYQNFYDNESCSEEVNNEMCEAKHLKLKGSK